MTSEEISETLTYAPWQLEHEVRRIPSRTDKLEWDYASRHFTCRVWRVGYGKLAPYCFEYSQGSAHTKPPTLADLMYCLIQDARASEDYEDEWEMAYEFGMEVKSKADYLRIVNMYAACSRMNDWIEENFTADERRRLDELFEDF